MEEGEDVYRFQEVDTDDEKIGVNGVLVDPAYHKILNEKQHINPDELYFNDMDLRAWERRTSAVDPLAYGEDYGYLEDEGYYEDPGPTMSQAEYEEYIFQGVLDKIRLARATGDADVQLTPEELDIYRTRLLRPRAPAARPQATVSVPLAAVNPPTSNGATAQASGSGSGSTRSAKNKQRSSIFAPRPKKEKPAGRKRAASNATEALSQAPTQAPGFVVPGPNGQPVYAPITAVRPGGSPSRPGSRSASMNSRHAQTPPREMPGGFPGSPTRFFQRETTPPRARPPSSSSRHSSAHSNNDYQNPQNTRSRSSSVQLPSKLVPFPVADYQHYNAEPYQYHPSGSSSSSAQPPSPQYARRVVSGPADGNYMAMPRRVPVPVQRATVPTSGVQSSYSDPTLPNRSSGLREEMADEADGGIIVDVLAQGDEKGLKVQTAKSSGKDSERRKRSGRSRKKN